VKAGYVRVEPPKRALPKAGTAVHQNYSTCSIPTLREPGTAHGSQGPSPLCHSSPDRCKDCTQTFSQTSNQLCIHGKIRFAWIKEQWNCYYISYRISMYITWLTDLFLSLCFSTACSVRSTSYERER
jgi:hypothetical protein